VIETLAAQKIVPILAPANGNGQIYQARWMPVLDGLEMGRLNQLVAAIPPICRSELLPPDPHGRPVAEQSPVI